MAVEGGNAVPKVFVHPTDEIDHNVVVIDGRSNAAECVSERLEVGVEYCDRHAQDSETP
jgi:NADPH-dependent glutamate synthase beta subunit-like oxidoreductase